MEPAFEPGALLDRPLGHPEALLAVVCEGSEAQEPPAFDVLEHHCRMAEGLVPAGALAHEPTQFVVEEKGISLRIRVRPRGRDGPQLVE